MRTSTSCRSSSYSCLVMRWERETHTEKKARHIIMHEESFCVCLFYRSCRHGTRIHSEFVQRSLQPPAEWNEQSVEETQRAHTCKEPERAGKGRTAASFARAAEEPTCANSASRRPLEASSAGRQAATLSYRGRRQKHENSSNRVTGKLNKTYGDSRR
jgi:hypothetical protein